MLRVRAIARRPTHAAMMLRHEWGTRRGLRLRTMRGWRLWAAYVILFRIIKRCMRIERVVFGGGDLPALLT